MEARAEQDGDIPERHTLLTELKYFLTDELRLHLLAARLDELRPRAGMFPGEKPLFIAFRGTLNDLVRHIQNRLRAAVILFELDDSCFGEVLGKVHDVAEIGAAEGIYALRIITDHGDVLMSSGEQAHDLGLELSLIHISEPTRLLSISYAVFCL